MKRKNRFLSALLCLVLLVSLAAPAAAEETGPRLEVSVSGSCYPGNNVTVYLELKEPDSLAVLDFDLHYDPAVLTLRSTTAGSDLTSSVNTDAAGVVRASVMKMDGIKDPMRVMTLSFAVASDAPAGKTPLTLAIGDAYRADLSEISLRGVDGAVTVVERTPSKPSMYVYSQATPSTLKQGETTDIRFYTYGTNGFASGVFDLRFDETLFAFESLTLGNVLEGGVSSVNSKNPGFVRVAFASENACPSGTFFTLRLRAIADVTTQTTVTLEATDLNTDTLQDMEPVQRSVNLSLEQLPPPAEDHPDLMLTAPKSIPEGREFDLLLSVEAESALAAGDFTLTYDPALFEIISEPTAAPELAAAGGMVMVNPNYGEGAVRFSFILESGVQEDQPMLVVPMRATGAIGCSGAFTASGRSLYDADYHAVYLDYPEAATEIICDHSSTKADYVAPTCIEPGTTGDVYCTICGEKLADGEVIPALGHDYKAVVTAPTCTEQGYTTYTCSRCGDSYVGDYVDPLGHDYDAVVTAPTCEEQGFTTYTCKHCGDQYVSNYVDALDHAWDDGVVTKPAACTEDGVMTYTCTRDASHTKTEAIPSLGHDYKAVVTAPTCTEQGFTTYTCSRCGDSYVGDHVDPLGHDYDAVVTVPTCEEQGYTTYTCKKCGDTYVSDYVDALDHAWGDGVVTKSAACTEDGVMTYTCTHDASHTKTEDIPALGHDYKAVVTAPTCTEQGYTTYTCKHCGDSYVGDYVDPLGHDYEAAVTAPTCTEQGFTTHTCKRCGDEYVDNYVDALGHNWDEGVVTQEPTATSEGVKTFTCTVCGETRTESIAKLVNPFTDVPSGRFYSDAVLWAYYHDPQITDGVTPTTFMPDRICTRAHVVTFLWRANGCPEPKNLSVRFKDVTDTSKYYYKAVLWAAEQEITTGYDDGTFRPDAECTRGHVVTFLWRANGEQAPTNTSHPFTDLNPAAYYYQAVLWARENGITDGRTPTTFCPNDACTRGHVVTFLYRAYA